MSIIYKNNELIFDLTEDSCKANEGMQKMTEFPSSVLHQYSHFPKNKLKQQTDNAPS